MCAYVINHSVLVLVAGALRTVAAPDAAQDVQHHARREDCHEPFSLFVLVCAQVINQEDLTRYIRVAKVLEDGHADPEPDIEGGDAPAEVAAKFEALFPGCHGHF